MKILFYLFGIIAIVQSVSIHDLNKVLNQRNNSRPINAFNDYMLTEIAGTSALAAFGITPTFDEFQNSFYKVLSAFLSLPVADQKLYYKQLSHLIDDDIKKTFAQDYFVLSQMENSAALRAIYEKAMRIFIETDDIDKAVESVKSDDAEMGKIMEKRVEKFKEEYSQLSQQGKQFVKNAWKRVVEYFEAGEKDDEKLAVQLRRLFVRLPQTERVDVLKRMTWFMKNYLKAIYDWMMVQLQELETLIKH